MSIWGTQPEDINRAEDRDLWYDVLTKLDIKQPPGQLQGPFKVARTMLVPHVGHPAVFPEPSVVRSPGTHLSRPFSYTLPPANPPLVQAPVFVSALMPFM